MRGDRMGGVVDLYALGFLIIFFILPLSFSFFVLP